MKTGFIKSKYKGVRYRYLQNNDISYYIRYFDRSVRKTYDMQVGYASEGCSESIAYNKRAEVLETKYNKGC